MSAVPSQVTVANRAAPASSRRWMPDRRMIWTAVVLLVLPLLLPNNFALDIAIRIAITAVAAIGLNILMGFAGQVSIGHAAFVAVGAYGSAIGTARFGWNPVVTLVAATAFSSLLAWLLAKAILRLRGHALTIATLGLGVIASMILVNEVTWTGGPDGTSVGPMTFAGFGLRTLTQWYFAAAVILFIAIRLALNLFDSPAGRAMRGLNSSEHAARTAGIDVGQYKAKAFVTSAAFASVSGSLMAHYIGFVSPSIASFTNSVELVTMVVLGGRASVFGSVLGTALLEILPQLLGGLHGYESILLGLILMATMIFLPLGLAPSLGRLFRRWSR